MSEPVNNEARERRSRVIRTALLLALMAVAVYVTFIVLAAERGVGLR